MSSRVQQYLKSIYKLGINKLKSEGHKLGLIINPLKDREQSIQAIQRLDPKVIERYLDKRDNYEPKPLQPIDKVFESYPSMPEKIEQMLHQLKVIRQIYLNQYTKKLNIKQKRIGHSVLLFATKINKSFINQFMGVRQEIQLDPKKIKYDYQRKSSELINELFPTYSNENYQNLLKNLKYSNKFIDVDQARAKLLIQYGVKKHLQFEQSIFDIFQSFVYSPSSYSQNKRKKLFNEVATKKPYLTFFFSHIDENISIKIIKEIQLYLKVIKQINYQTIQKVLWVCSMILSNKQIQLSIQQKTQKSLLITSWIVQQLKYFWNYYKQAGIDMNKLRDFFFTIKQYLEVKQKLQSIDLPVTIRTSLQIIQQLEEHQKILKDCEQIGIGIGITDMGKQEISQTFFITNEVINYADQQQLQLSPLLLEQILLSFRNALEWYRQFSNIESSQFSSNNLFVPSVETNFNHKFCFSLINKVFMSQKIDLEFFIVIQYFWKFIRSQSKLQEDSIKSLFMMIRITIDYDQASIFQKNDKITYPLLVEAIQQIRQKRMTALQTPEIIKLLEESGIMLISDSHKKLYLETVKTIKTPIFDKYIK